MVVASGKILDKVEQVECWITNLEGRFSLPIYSSVDIRDSEFKSAVVDTNLFPAGFNNLPVDSHQFTANCFTEAFFQAGIQPGKILLIIEEHTRNKWYLENVFVLKSMLKLAGFSVDITLPGSGEGIEKSLETAKGNIVQLTPLQEALEKTQDYQCALLNNDLSSGIPEFLANISTKVIPNPFLGWHSRSKKNHFDTMANLLHQLAELLDIDPWQLITMTENVDRVSVHDLQSRESLADKTNRLLERISEKYKEFGIQQKPYVYIKSDQGTYGMAIQVVDDAQQVLDFNRKIKNKLNMGKGANQVTNFILQEGIPTDLSVNGFPAEVVLYQVDKYAVGGFYRVNSEKDKLGNLNSRGMTFHSIPGTNKNATERVSYFHRLLGRIAAVAAACEIKRVDQPNETCFSN
jgi:glutamate--cysteine ligase